MAATWVMMAIEGPFVAAIIARLPEPTYNLAAHGVAFALAMLFEAPVLMLMSATTSLVRDRTSFLRLRAFSRGLMLGATGVVLVVLSPPVYDFLTITVMRLPPEVSELTRGALWFFLPWPAAIGYRRFLQGVMIRAGKTRLVAYGTMIRLCGMVTAALFGFLVLDIPGAWVGALALISGVITEAVTARFMAASTVRSLLSEEREGSTPREIPYREIASFYFPLALTSLIGLAVQPMLTFFMGRSVSPVESLAVFPVVMALSFFFRALGLAFQDVAIALMGERFENLPELRRFAGALGLAVSGGIALVTFTPLSDVYFMTISGLTPELTSFALTPARVVVPMPALSVLLSTQRAILVEGRRTRFITVASAIEILTVAATFVAFGWGLGLIGATAAFAAFLVGRTASNTYLYFGCQTVLRGKRGLVVRPSGA